MHEQLINEIYEHENPFRTRIKDNEREEIQVNTRIKPHTRKISNTTDLNEYKK